MKRHFRDRMCRLPRQAIAAAASASVALAPLTSALAATTQTPIQHVIIIIGENHSFDNVYATYQPQAGNTVANLLSKGIVNADGTPGPNFALAAQKQASVTGTFSIAPTVKTPYRYLPPAMTDGVPQKTSAGSPPFNSLATAQALDGNDLSPGDAVLVTTGASGLPGKSVDTRMANPTKLPNGPFQITGPNIPYDSYTASPVHRFYQMWQQMDCSVSHATPANPSGCLNDLFPWVETTVAAGSNGAAQPANFNDQTTGEGSTSMGFFNVQSGDAPYFKELADKYTMSDNFHQSISGGTGANHIVLGTGLGMYYSDGQGNIATPPSNEIENPNPQAGTNNYYTQDGYSGGSYSKCADATQPGVQQILGYLAALPAPSQPRSGCVPGAYYLLNNYNPGYLGNGTVNTSTFTIPPSHQKTIGDSLNAAGISWRYYGESWDAYVSGAAIGSAYCNICNPFQYVASIMTDATQRTTHITDIPELDADITNNTLPAVSFIKPNGLNDGHPASSKLDIFESFTKRIVKEIQANPTLWATTAIFITMDEGGGSWDSGYIQPLDFFGDGTRMPAIMVSPYSEGGHISHVYGDHVSYLKFIEFNWGISPVAPNGRDNYPNPNQTGANPYAPINSPAIGDLTDMFNFNLPAQPPI
ncbi:MAG: phosphoesterase [Alphaproteobacteria bacterium]|nr:phosphoesterase [Alphaproteobacteria bacterium]